MADYEFHAWRKRMHLSQQEAAETLGISKRQIGSYDRGEKPIPRLVALAIAYLEEANHP